MKKIYIIALCLLLFFPILSYSAQAADTRSVSVGVPTTMGLTGTDNSAKTFYLDLPNGVTSTSIKTGSFKYNGNNSVIGAITIENGKIKVTLKGNEKAETFSVEGFNDLYKDNFISVPGNSIWRYSDGRRWQINDYKVNKGSNESHNENAADSGVPSSSPPRTPVTTKSDPVDPIQATWYRNGVNTVPYSSVVQSSIRPNPLALLGDVGQTYIKDGKFIITYTVPSSLFSPEDVPESFGKGGWVIGRLYYVTLPYYFTATAKVTSYSYAGNVSFDYSLPTDAELNGTVAVLKPNPNPTNYDDKDVPVQLSLRGELLRYTNTSNISEWVFYAKEKGKDNTLQIKKDYTKTLNSNKQFDFTIPKSRVISDNYRQEYELTVIVRFSTPVTTQSGTITSLQQPLSAIVEVYKGPVPSAPPATNGQPPVAILMVSPVVKAGEDVVAKGGGSYDPDGEIKSYSFNAPGSISLPTPTESTSTFWYPVESIGVNAVGLTVVDNDRLSGSTEGFIKVVQPIPDARIEVSGTKKQNRKVIITSDSTSPFYYPLDQSKTKITITAISGGTNADIKYAGPLSGVTANPVLFKKPGIYRASIYVENTLGYSATDQVNFEIVPDDPPVVYFSMPGRVYRDPLNGNKAVVSLDDMSYSPDGDIIDQRLWEYRYDSDNDGSYEDESWVIFNNENKDRLNLTLTEVGKYEIRHTVYEAFGQPTIDTFVTPADRKSADSSSQNIAEKIVDVKNRAPQGDWAW